MDRSGLSAPIVTESVTFLPTVPVSAGSLTGTVAGGYGVPGCRTSDRVQVTTWPLTEHCQPLPDGVCGVRPAGTWKTTVAVPRVGPAPGSSDTASWELLPDPPGVNVPEWLTASRRSGASPVTVMPWISWKFVAAPVAAANPNLIVGGSCGCPLIVFRLMGPRTGTGPLPFKKLTKPPSTFLALGVIATCLLALPRWTAESTASEAGAFTPAMYW